MLTKTQKLVVALATILVGALFCLIPNTAFAGAAGSYGGGGGGGGGDGSGNFDSSHHLGGAMDLNPGVSTISGPAGSITVSHGGITWLTGRASGGQWIRGSWLLPRAACHFDVNYGAYPGVPDGRFASEALREGFDANNIATIGYSSVYGGGTASGGLRGGDLCDAVWIGYRVEDCSQSGDTITYLNTLEDPNTPTIDNSKYGAEGLGKNKITDASYQYTTKINEDAVTKTVNETVKHLKYHRTRCIFPDGHAEERDGVGYVSGAGFARNESIPIYQIIGDPAVYKADMSYTRNVPTVHKELYQPINLNKSVGNYDENHGGKASDTPGISDGGGAGKINGTADNQKGITDNKDIEMIDLNNDCYFKVNFKDGPFGLPSKYKGNNHYTHGDGRVQRTENGAYANGWNADGDTEGPDAGGQRGGTTLNATVGDINNSGMKLSSLHDVSDPQEKKAGETITYGVTGSVGGSSGTDKTFGVRAIQNGTFTTSAPEKATEFQKLGTVTWNKSKYWEYGVHYSGHVNTSGIQAPAAGASAEGIQTSCDVTKNSSGWNLATNGDKEHRGLYIDLATHGQGTPVLYGHWKVATIAGSAQ